MEIRTNATGPERKRLVQALETALDVKAKYLGAPSMAYEVGDITVNRNGSLTIADGVESEKVKQAIDAAKTARFDCEPDEAFRKTPDAETGAASESESTCFTIEMPLSGFDPDSLDRLQKLIGSKARLIQKALGAAGLTVSADAEKVSFPWFDRIPTPEELNAYSAFIAALCRMAKTSSRVTATEKEVESEKYAFRGFLLRLGFIGDDTKEQRKILMKNLSGSAAFPNKAAADAFNAAQKAKRDSAKEVQP